MTQEQKPIDFNSDYVRKVQAGILLPKKSHENFELLKTKVNSIEDIVNKILAKLDK